MDITSYYHFFIAPTPSVSLTPFSLRLPNHPNYNQVTFNCTGTVPLVDDMSLEFDKVFVWILHDNDVTNSATTPSTPRAALSFSTLSQTFSIAGQYGLSCRVSISVTGDPVVSSTNNTVVTVTSKIIYMCAIAVTFSFTTFTVTLTLSFIISHTVTFLSHCHHCHHHILYNIHCH